MLFCNKCGTQNIDSKKFCNRCGNLLLKPSSPPPIIHQQIKEEVKVHDNQVQNPARGKRITKLGWAIFGAFIFLGLIMGGYFIFRNQETPVKENDELLQSDETPIVVVDSVVAPVDSVTYENIDSEVEHSDDPGIQTSTPTLIPGSDNVTQEEANEIANKLSAFYEADNKENTDVILGFFAYPMKRYYETYNVSYEQLKEMYAVAFNSKLLSHHITVHWNSSSVDKIGNGYLVKANATYFFVTQKTPDEERSRNFNIIISMNANKEITAIYENP